MILSAEQLAAHRAQERQWEEAGYNDEQIREKRKSRTMHEIHERDIATPMVEILGRAGEFVGWLDGGNPQFCPVCHLGFSKESAEVHVSRHDMTLGKTLLGYTRAMRRVK